MRPKVIILLVIALLVLVIMVQNTQATTLYLLFWTVTISKIILLALTLLAGFIIGYLTSLLTKKDKRWG